MTTETGDTYQLPSLQFLFANENRESIMFDMIGQGQDFRPEMTQISSDFGIDFSNPIWRCYQFAWWGDGSWLGVWLGDKVLSEDNLLRAPIIYCWSDDYPEVNLNLNIIGYIKQNLEKYLQGSDIDFLSYTKRTPSDLDETQRMISDLENQFPEMINSVIKHQMKFSPPIEE